MRENMNRPGLMTADAAGRLSRQLDPSVRAGAEPGVMLQVIEEALDAAGAIGDPDARRMVVGSMVGSMIRYSDRRANLVLLHAGITRHLQLEDMSHWLTDWIVDLYESPLDPAADSMRAVELKLHLSGLAPTLPEAARLLRAASALCAFTDGRTAILKAA